MTLTVIGRDLNEITASGTTKTSPTYVKKYNITYNSNGQIVSYTAIVVTADKSLSKSATVVIKNNSLKSAGNGLSNGDRVAVYDTNGILLGVFYVVKVDDNDFKLSLTEGGDAIDLSGLFADGASITYAPAEVSIEYVEILAYDASGNILRMKTTTTEGGDGYRRPPIRLAGPSHLLRRRHYRNGGGARPYIRGEREDRVI
jgi:hypothetical protein